MRQIEPYTKLLRGIALVALAFAFIMCVMVILNYLQLSRIDPVNTEIIDQLVSRLNENPADQALREQIRELDLLARKAYFTNTWQVRMGAYLILIALAIFFILYQLLELNIRKQVQADPDAPVDVLGIQKNARRGIAGLGGILVLTALSLSFIKPHSLTKQLEVTSDNAVVSHSFMPDTMSTGETSVPLGENIEPSDTAKVSVSSDWVGQQAAEEGLTENRETEKTTQTGLDLPSPEKKEKAPVNPGPDPVPSVEQLMNNAASFRGFNGNGIVYQQDIPVSWDGPSGKNILWKTPIPIKSYNSPIVWENRVFLSGANEQKREVYAFDRNSGEILWTHRVDGIPGSPQVPPKTTPDTGLGAPTMTTDGQRVYALFGTGDLIALDFSGKRIWAKNIGVPDNHYGHSSSLIMHREKLIVQYDHKKSAGIMAFKGSTGELVWSTDRNVKASWASPVIIRHNGKSQIVLAADPMVIAYNPGNGKELWRSESIFGEVGPSVCFDDGVVYVVNDYAQIAAIQVDNPGEPLWTNTDILSDIPSPVAANGLLIMPTSYGLLGCYDGKSGELLWEHEFDESAFASPILIGTRVYLLDTGGTMHIFRLSGKGFEAIAENRLGENTVATPAFAAGRIYIRTDENLYCIGNK